MATPFHTLVVYGAHICDQENLELIASGALNGPFRCVLDDEGDLWLRVGGDLGEVDCKLRVCSRALRRASPVWKAMLFGPWAEAKPSAGQWVVAMPEEKPLPFAVLMAIVHGRLDLIPSDVLDDDYNFPVISDVLIIAEKYDVTHLLALLAPTWMAHAHPCYGGDYLIWSFCNAFILPGSWGAPGDLAESSKTSPSGTRRSGRYRELLEYAKQCPQLAFPSVLPDIIDIVPEVRRSVIPSLLDFFTTRLINDAKYYNNLDWFYGSPIVGEPQRLRDFRSRICNSLVIGDIFRYLGGVGKVLPKEAEGMPLGVEELVGIMKTAFAGSSNGSVLLPGYERCGVAEAFEVFHSDLIEEWMEEKQVLSPEHTERLNERGDKMFTRWIEHQVEWLQGGHPNQRIIGLRREQTQKMKRE